MHRFPRGSTSRDPIHGRNDDGSGEGIFQVKHGKSSQGAVKESVILTDDSLVWLEQQVGSAQP